MDQTITYILFAHVMALMIGTVLQLTLRIRSRVNNLMALLYFITGSLFFYFWSYRTNVIFRFPYLMHSDLAVTFTIGPVLYAYIKSITGDDIKFSLKSFLQYIPAVLVLCFFIIYDTRGNAPAGNGGNLYPGYHSDPTVYIISTLADTWLFIYMLLVIIKIYGLKQKEKFRSVKEIRAIFYIFTGFALSNSLLLPAHFFKSDLLIGLVSIINGSFAVTYFIFSYRYPEYTQMVIKEPKPARDPGTLPGTVNLPGIIENLITFMETEKIYHDPEISLQSLSNLLKVSSNHLSLILNEKLGMNFRTFINRYRIEEAGKLLMESHEMTVLEIAFFVGFNSKTTFNTVFSDITGLTPTAYRKKFS